ncbi:GNAT family N-acetyltransferase [Pseudomonas petrae]|uniref:GNAT family N-acetyltransferase n=1 Tax=Pseudomonas petrae TaxID=2912190 RepID=A0ABS9I178_9PSED|nr:GNAT family protein [Pseudomonas petrae]MCF7531604.1 GNAT family N-acetyltransferase [Pseudomonas petrae]MCF7537167.1 GNAT family N-acetyltransferase [Pseudomonas petrae]MCF7540843.1 GNAT family N-acetyltransferase [Pseudomonas petrae]MCF7556373.1 GNAT family N-acetyltransferase [Pseudomonas petrae]
MSDLTHWQPAKLPDTRTLQGRFIRLEKLNAARHGDGLWEALEGPAADRKLWDYLFVGPFPERGAFDDYLAGLEGSTDPWFYTVVDQQTGAIHGFLGLMSIFPSAGRIEIGHVTFGASMQRTPKATEAVYLLARESFALGNRRLEWKCNANNARSKRAAERFGFSFEGTFRQHSVFKGQNRDTAWYSIIDSEWPVANQAFEGWLAVDNFKDGQQIRTLEQLRGS